MRSYLATICCTLYHHLVVVFFLMEDFTEKNRWLKINGQEMGAGSFKGRENSSLSLFRWGSEEIDRINSPDKQMGRGAIHFPLGGGTALLSWASLKASTQHSCGYERRSPHPSAAPPSSLTTSSHRAIDWRWREVETWYLFMGLRRMALGGSRS